MKKIKVSIEYKNNNVTLETLKGKQLKGLLADAALGAVLIDLVAYAGSFLAAGADDLDLGRIHSAFSLDDAAGLAHTSGLDVLRDDVDLLYDDLALFGGYR